MSQSRERSRLVGLPSDFLDGDDQTVFTRLHEHYTHYSSQDNAPFSHPYAEVDLLGTRTLPSQTFGFNADLEIEGDLGESLAGLELNASDGFSNTELPDSTFGGMNSMYMDVNHSRRIPEMTSPRLLSSFESNRTSGAYTIPTSSQPSYGANSPSAWPPLGHRFGENFANLRPQIYTPQRSSAATHSQNSESGWETLPSSPLADDSNAWLVPDENSASMESHIDPLTGIWTPEDAYGQVTPYSSMRDMGHDNGVNFTMTQLLRPDLQQVIDNADAATPFRTQSNSNGGFLFVTAGLAVNENPQIAANLFSPPSTSGGPVSQSFQTSINGQSGISIVIDSTMNLGASLARQPPAVDRFLYPLGSGQSSSSNIAPRMALDNPTPLSARDLPPTMLMGPLAPALSPSPSADTSTAEVVRCTHTGCRTVFRGAFWRDSQRRHNTHYHSDKTKPICPVCDEVFSSGRPDNLIRHFKRKHPGYPLPPSRNARPRKLGQRRRRS